MRTTLDIDRDLLIEAKELGDFPSFNATICAAIQELIDTARSRRAETRFKADDGSSRSRVDPSSK